MAQGLKIIRLQGQEAFSYIPHLAQLRIKVFREYPYLYDGDLDYENKYLQTYLNCPESVIVLVMDGTQIVGASTAIPLSFETDECQEPFIENGLEVAHYFYLGESVLLPEYRGQGVYKRFFEEREKAARTYGSRYAAFCAVKRAKDDPRAPHGYTPLDNIWRYFGYEQSPNLSTYFGWKEIGEDTQTKNPMTFWLKTL